jgi:hypothetical protein
MLHAEVTEDVCILRYNAILYYLPDTAKHRKMLDQDRRDAEPQSLRYTRSHYKAVTQTYNMVNEYTTLRNFSRKQLQTRVPRRRAPGMHVVPRPGLRTSPVLGELVIFPDFIDGYESGHLLVM